LKQRKQHERNNGPTPAKAAERDAATDRARVIAILDSIKEALSEATAEHTGLKTRIDDVLARAAVTVGNDTDEYLTRDAQDTQDTQYQNLLGLETANGQLRLGELEASIAHYRFLKAALLSRFPDVIAQSEGMRSGPATK
jgi:hypothetical protein